MEYLIRPMDRREHRTFLLCLLASATAHLLLAMFAVGSGTSLSGREERPGGLGERFARAVNAATDLDAPEKERLEKALSQVPAAEWKRGEMAATLQWLASDLGLPVRDADVVRSLDPERSREGRWDLRLWIDWPEGAGASPLLGLCFLVGEGTLRSDFGSHRLWIHLDAPDGAGRVAFETMDCRLYRAGKLAASDLLHRSAWSEP
ncbi:MAG: hypothetical protein Kow0092_12170 [Deferrisomatales bacterium]